MHYPVVFKNLKFKIFMEIYKKIKTILDSLWENVCKIIGGVYEL